MKNSVKEKSGQELLDHYGLAEGERLTNLGILLLGTTAERARLGCAPVVQLIRYDEHGKKVGKYSWDDYEYSPVELVELIWRDTPELQERYEIPDGLLRETVPAFDPAVLRELLVNALVHRPYTQRGDVYLNLHPDRLEVVNPGRLPLGVTPRNILHTSRRRNDGLARVFHDLRLMEREGSGFDLMYERLLATGRHVPTVREGIDSVMVSVPRRVLYAGVIELLAAADRRHGLSQREKITLGLLAQSEGLSGVELTSLLELDEKNSLRPWLGRLVELELVVQAGRTKGTRYFVPPELLRGAGLDRKTTLRRVQAPRLRALILEDLERYPDSSSSDLHRRIGLEIPIRSVRRMLEELVQGGRVEVSGSKRWTRYRVSNANR